MDNVTGIGLSTESSAINVDIFESNFLNNQLGLRLYSQNNLISKCKFEQNHTAFSTSGGSTNIENALFKNNSNAVESTGSLVDINNSTIYGGGALWVYRYHKFKK